MRSHIGLFAWMVGVVTSGCTGQSGTELPSCMPSCICTNVVSAGTPVRATVIERRGEFPPPPPPGMPGVASPPPPADPPTVYVRARVDELLDPSSTPAGLTVGMEVGGDWYGACATRGDLSVSVGDSVLLFYSRGAQDSIDCSEYRTCSLMRCGAEPGESATLEDIATWDQCDEGCLEATRGACEMHASIAWLEGRVAVATWSGGTWTFGRDDSGPLTLPDDQLSTLLDPAACTMRFPAPPCDDTP